MEIILETRNLTKLFGTLAANKDISIKVKRGTIHSVIGENGAGKSTLMNMIAGVLKPTDGKILINGKEVNFKNADDATNLGIGMVHQEFMLFPGLTVLENLMMRFESTKLGVFLDKKKARKEILEICSLYNFSIPLDAMVKDLPVSILQQVEIVKILYRGADIIILDEPTSVLTPQGIEGLFKAMRYLISLGKTIILITHKLNEVMEISDAITVLKDGKVTGNVLPYEVDEEKLASLMVGREVLFNTKKKQKTPGEVLLKVDNLTVLDKDNIEKIKNVSFEVQRGEIVGIAGVAGSGQVQLVEALFGLGKTNSGKIIFKGKDITNSSPRELRREKIGYVPQDRIGYGSNVEASILENCIMGYHISHGFTPSYLVNYSQASAFTNSVIETYRVKTDSVTNKVKSLSGGNVQKLIVGREFLQNNDFLIIEDPTRGIDVGAIEFIWQRIIDISEQGVGILLVSHELSEIMELSDRILVLHNGRINADLIAKEVDEYTVGMYMLGGIKNAKK